MSDDYSGDAGEQLEAPPKPVVVQGITEMDFALWRQGPITKLFLQYLLDRKADFTAGVMEQWLGGVVQLSDQHETRGYAKCLGEIAETRLPIIAKFYDDLKSLEAGEHDDSESVEKGGQGAPAS